jgi:hypothetical protein
MDGLGLGRCGHHAYLGMDSAGKEMEGPEAASYRILSLVQGLSFSDPTDLVEGCGLRGRLIRGVRQLSCVVVPFMVQEADDLLIEDIAWRFALNLGIGGNDALRRDLRCS